MLSADGALRVRARAIATRGEKAGNQPPTPFHPRRRQMERVESHESRYCPGLFHMRHMHVDNAHEPENVNDVLPALSVG